MRPACGNEAVVGKWNTFPDVAELEARHGVSLATLVKSRGTTLKLEPCFTYPDKLFKHRTENSEENGLKALEYPRKAAVK